MSANERALIFSGDWFSLSLYRRNRCRTKRLTLVNLGWTQFLYIFWKVVPKETAKRRISPRMEGKSRRRQSQLMQVTALFEAENRKREIAQRFRLFFLSLFFWLRGNFTNTIKSAIYRKGSRRQYQEQRTKKEIIEKEIKIGTDLGINIYVDFFPTCSL